MTGATEALPDFDLVLFGATGDLAMRKLVPALFALEARDMSQPGARIFAIARSEYSTEGYRDAVETALRRHLPERFDPAIAGRLLARIEYRTVASDSAAAMRSLAAELRPADACERLFYLAVPPGVMVDICDDLAAAGLNRNSRIVLEKPIGHDQASCRATNDAVGRYFDEDQIFRIDHYLGKESVQNLLALRFGNALFETLWNRQSISHVQISVSETVGVEGRAPYYDGVGALRDMVQNHILQVLAAIAMEPPMQLDEGCVRDEKVKVLRSLVPITGGGVSQATVRGQYRGGIINGEPVCGYLEEQGVDPASHSETYAAIHCEIANWRWAGVPFYLRTGKRMAQRLAEIVIFFRPVAHDIFGTVSELPFPNRLVIRLNPDDSLDLNMLAKIPGERIRLAPITLNLSFEQAFRQRTADAYERLLMDLINNRLMLFVRRDEIEQAWAWIDPIEQGWAESTAPPRGYNAGTWGPQAASALVARGGHSWSEEL